MRVLIRRCHTGEYMAALDTWVLDPGDAHNFVRPDEAILFAQGANLPDVELVLRYERPPSETVLNIPSKYS
jgi:hypothetical protein